MWATLKLVQEVVKNATPHRPVRKMPAHLGGQLPLGGCPVQGRSSELWLPSGSLSKPSTGLNRQVQAKLYKL